MNKKLGSLLLILLLILPISIFAVPKNLPVPRFVTIKFNEVNTRVGPEKNCPIEWVFTKKGEPVEVIAEYDQWRQIRDIEGEGGWVHSSLISGHRAVIITGKDTVHLTSSPGGGEKELVAYLKPNLRCSLIRCKEKWCKISCQGKTGWVSRNLLWGIYPEE